MIDAYRNCKEGAIAVWDGPHIGVAISGYDLITLNKMELEECKLACLQRTEMNCRSFDYRRDTKTCYLQSVTR